MQMLIPLPIGACRLQEGERSDAGRHHVFDDVSLPAMSSLAVRLLSWCLLDAVNERMHMRVLLIEGIISRTRVKGARQHVGIKDRTAEIDNLLPVSVAHEAPEEDHSIESLYLRFGAELGNCVFMMVANMARTGSAPCVIML
jgi:hypothetical protein